MTHPRSTEALDAIKALIIDANRLCDRQLGGTYEDDCRRSIAKAKEALALLAVPPEGERPQYSREEFERDRAQGWQPIETAPKDGTLILLCRVGVVTGELFVVSGCWNSGGAYLMPHWQSSAQMHNATHWMPIPKLLLADPPAREET